MHILPFLGALGAAGVMGFANQRGGTCTVAAIEEIVSTHRFGRLLALFETSLWVGGGLLLLNAANALPTKPRGYAAGLSTVAGGILFGLGAFVNRACLFGTVARLGSGEWAYAATPAGVFIGSLTTAGLQLATRLDKTSPLLSASAWSALGALVFFILRTVTHGVAIRRSNRHILERIWSPHIATTVIGLAFLMAFVMAGDWDYADFLSDLAHGRTLGWMPKALLSMALVAGAIAGGWTAGRIKLVSPSPSSLVRHFAGGFLMGAGASVIPGGNTGIILLGMPMLWSYAWLAFVTICVTIYLAIHMTRFGASMHSEP